MTKQGRDSTWLQTRPFSGSFRHPHNMLIHICFKALFFKMLPTQCWWTCWIEGFSTQIVQPLLQELLVLQGKSVIGYWYSSHGTLSLSRTWIFAPNSYTIHHLDHWFCTLTILSPFRLSQIYIVFIILWQVKKQTKLQRHRHVSDN